MQKIVIRNIATSFLARGYEKCVMVLPAHTSNNVDDSLTAPKYQDRNFNWCEPYMKSKTMKAFAMSELLFVPLVIWETQSSR